jgi:hypothetical protein
MHNQHTDLSQTLADQHRTHLQDQATHRRPLHAPRLPRRRRPSRAPRWEQQPDGCGQLIRWPAVPAAEQPSRHPHCVG